MAPTKTKLLFTTNWSSHKVYLPETRGVRNGGVPARKATFHRDPVCAGPGPGKLAAGKWFAARIWPSLKKVHVSRPRHKSGFRPKPGLPTEEPKLGWPSPPSYKGHQSSLCHQEKQSDLRVKSVVQKVRQSRKRGEFWVTHVKGSGKMSRFPVNGCHKTHLNKWSPSKLKGTPRMPHCG